MNAAWRAVARSRCYAFSAAETSGISCSQATFEEAWFRGFRWNTTAATTETLAHVLSNGEKVLFQNRETSKKIHVLGVAHASEKGAETVRQQIRELKPSVVVLPLCNMRYTAMIENKPLIPEEVLKVVREQGDATGVKIPGFSGQHAQFVLKAILQGFGIEPGPAMRAAVATAHEMGATIELAEPQVDTLIKEAMDSAEKLRQSGDNLQQRAQTAATAMRGQLGEFASALRAESGMSFRGGDFREMAQLANINRRRTARAAVSIMRTLVPEITEVIIDKRDEEIARRLLAFTSDNPAAGYDYFDEVNKDTHSLAILGITQLDGVESQFYANYIDPDVLWEEGVESAMPHSSVFEGGYTWDDPPKEEPKATNVAWWKKVFGLNKGPAQ